MFSQQLQRLLDRAGPSWEVVNLSMMGWNTANELSALRVLLPSLQPDVVVICPTSNDIDDSYTVWRGHLARAGFDSAAIFRNSYEYERRWVEVFRRLQEEVRVQVPLVAVWGSVRCHSFTAGLLDSIEHRIWRTALTHASYVRRSSSRRNS